MTAEERDNLDRDDELDEQDDDLDQEFDDVDDADDADDIDDADDDLEDDDEDLDDIDDDVASVSASADAATVNTANAASGAGSSAAADQLADFVRHVLSNLVDESDQLQVIPEQRGSSVHIRVLVPEEELGRVIGRQGRIARSMRTLLTIAAARRSLRASLDIDAAQA